ncbi:MAG: ABC transporter ATP-binding protein [Intestinimonas sp.]|jgi:putative ABC transport system ATP-binding protein|nr:ABC transporter ATP-binding protein [Intestinimonas sp.]
MDPILSVLHLQKIYGGRGSRTRALSDLSFDVAPGEFVGIMGASGSGKTTLLNCVSTIDRPTAGSIIIAGEDITALRGRALSRFRRERLGFIFQDCNLLDTLTAFENIALALTILKAPAGEIEDRVQKAAGLLGLDRVLDKYPYQLSGGECQRVAAARAIITKPALILADEPTGALDSKSARMLLTQLAQLNRETGATILMVTHDAFTASWCHRILFIRDGTLHQVLRRENMDRRAFFARILGVVGQMEGDGADVL